MSEWTLIIIGIAIGMNVIALIAELLMHDREKLRDLKLKMKEKQDEVKRLSKKKDPASLKEMSKVQKEMFSLTGQQMKMSFRSLIITFPIFILMFWWLSSQGLDDFTFPIVGGWYLYYIMVYIIISAVMSPIKNQILWGHWRGAVHAEKLKQNGP